MAREFGQGDFPFYWVQLANFNGGDRRATNWAPSARPRSRRSPFRTRGWRDHRHRSANDIHPKTSRRSAGGWPCSRRRGVRGHGGLFRSHIHGGRRSGRHARQLPSRAGLTAAGKPFSRLSSPARSEVPPARRPSRGKGPRQFPQGARPVAVRYACETPRGKPVQRGRPPGAPFRSDRWPR